jgi:hypothetical protein
MAATLRLDKFQLMYLLEGAVGKSHLRWDIYPMMVNDVWPQLTESEREFIFTYVKRDDSWYFCDEKQYVDETAKEYYLQMLARYNPANQYGVTMKKGRGARQIANDAYLWDGKYYVGWQRYCAPEYITKVEQKPYNKCGNVQCKMRDICLRQINFNFGDKTLDGSGVWSCENCDFLITKVGVIDPIAKMVITKENKENEK